jgi:copper chaperone NosL
MRRLLAVGLSIALALLALACDDAQRPEEPVWNKQTCAHCRMILSDPRYAAQLTQKDGRRLYFDDVGCLAAYLNREKPAVTRVWVRDRGAWHVADELRYTRGHDTPMGFGFVAAAQGELEFSAVRKAVAAEHARGDQP